MGFKGRTLQKHSGGLLESRFDLPLDPILCDAFLGVVLKSFPNLLHTIVCCVLERVLHVLMEKEPKAKRSQHE